LLRADASGSLRGAAILGGEEYLGAWGGLVHSAMTGETAFNHAFGTSQWEHRREHTELSDLFSAGLREETADANEAILAAYDFSAFRTVADVGGGHGSLLAAILRRHSAVAGILFDQPHVVGKAREHLEEAGLARRCQVIGGDFFEGLPGGADAHVLKSVIHDWDDEQSLAILANCHEAMEEDGTLLLVERIMPDRAEDDPDTVLLDVHMLAVTGGLERTEAEYGALLTAAGFRPTRVIPTRCRFSLIEGLRL
jgi:SAM-dependent methyltransferase